jgi:hypothetical protein
VLNFGLVLTWICDRTEVDVVLKDGQQQREAEY